MKTDLFLGSTKYDGRVSNSCLIPGLDRQEHVGHEAAAAVALIYGIRRQMPVGFPATVD